MSPSNPMTTGQAAQYCHVSQATIINWIKEDKLKAYTTPGGHHRILLSDFLSFLETYRMPVAPTLRTALRPRVLVVSDATERAQLARALQENEQFDVAWASSDYEAGAQVTRFKPDAVVLDMTSSAPDCLTLCRWLHDSTEGQSISVLTVGAPEDKQTALAAGADAHLPATAIADKLEEELNVLLESKHNE